MPEITKTQREVLGIRYSIQATCRVCSKEGSDCSGCNLLKWKDSLTGWLKWRLSSVSDDILVFCSNRCGHCYLLCEFMAGDGGKSCPMWNGMQSAKRGYKAKETLKTLF